MRTAAAAAEGGAIAVHAYDAGRVDLVRREGDRLVADGSIVPPGRRGFPHPPPGRNVALSADGRTLLVGAVERDCRHLGTAVRCGNASLWRRGPEGWRLAETLARPSGVGEGAHFGQAVLLLPDGAAIVGGGGIADGPGALHLFVRRGGSLTLAQTLHPEGSEAEFYAADLAASGDGRWLAVGQAQAVTLYRREGEIAGGRFAPAARLEAPEDNAGHFGEAVALNADGTVLLVGAPRAGCRDGPRCGVAYRYRRDARGGWRPAGALRPPVERAQAGFGHALALDAAGRAAAAEGAAVYVERQPGGRWPASPRPR